MAIELATKQRDACQRKVAVLEKNLMSVNAQFEQLQSYAADKDCGWTNSESRGVSAEIVRHHYQFVARLQQAMGMQADVVTRVMAQVEAAKKALVAQEIRLDGLSKVFDRRLNAKAKLVLRRDQKITDEFASQNYARRHADLNVGDGR